MKQRMDCHTPFLGVQIVYYDGQFDDARLNVTLAVSAAQAGATTTNYTEVTELLKVRCTRSGKALQTRQ